MFLSFLRNSKIQLILRYLTDFTKRNPIHGLSYLAKRYIHWTEFLYWILCILFMAIFGFVCGLQLLHDYRSRNSAITINIDYMKINTLYPATTICPHIILDHKKVEEYINNYNGQMDKNKLYTFLQKLSKITVKKAHYPDLANNQIPAEDYMQLIFNLSHSYDVTIHNQPAVKIMTDVGICYTFSNYLSDEMYTKNWGDLQPYPLKLIDRFKFDTFNFTQQFPIDFSLKHNITGNVSLYIHSPYEVPTIWSRSLIKSNLNSMIKITGVIREITYQKMLLNETSIKERRCRTINESNLKMFPLTYSRNLCLMECRAHYIAKICNCIPHFYNRNDKWNDVPICNVNGLNCFARHINIFRTITANPKSPIFKCYHCYPNCIEQVVLKKIVNIKRIKMNNTILLGIEYPSTETFERSVMYTHLDYIVTLSSVLSAFFGFCVYSLCDFLYFFTIRIYWFNKGYRGSVDENY